MKKRSNFSGKLGFVMSAAASAVGLGNLWRFPYLAAKYGGGTFLLVYLILMVTFGFTLMVSEIGIGRKTGLSVISAYKKLDKRFAFIGIISAFVPALILPYYSVIGGWVCKYTAVFLAGGGTEAVQDGFFTGFITSSVSPLMWFALFVLLTSVIVIMGVEKGIEKCSKIMMPILIILSIIIAGYGLTTEGALEGLKYYITPDLSKLTAKTVLAALGQLFYSMSLAMGVMVTYGSYMKKETNIESSIRHIELFDTGIAFLAGLMIVPAVYAFSGGDQSALSAGPGLMFITLPKIFNNMAFGGIIGFMFFILVLFAALTSSVSLMETVVSMVQDKLKASRKVATVAVGLFTFALGVPSSLGFGVWSGVSWMGMSILDMFDFISNSILMPLVALMTCLFIGYVIKPSAIVDEVEANGEVFKSKKSFVFITKYIAPIGIVAILISFVAAGLGFLQW